VTSLVERRFQSKEERWCKASVQNGDSCVNPFHARSPDTIAFALNTWSPGEVNSVWLAKCEHKFRTPALPDDDRRKSRSRWEQFSSSPGSWVRIVRSLPTLRRRARRHIGSLPARSTDVVAFARSEPATQCPPRSRLFPPTLSNQDWAKVRTTPIMAQRSTY
jgi:hypothetical protein